MTTLADLLRQAFEYSQTAQEKHNAFLAKHGMESCKEVVRYRSRIKACKVYEDALFWDKFCARAEARAISCANSLMRQ